MSAAVAHSTRLPLQASSIHMDQNNVIKSEDQSHTDTTSRSKTSPAQTDIQPSKQESTDQTEHKATDSNADTQPLAPPPRPSQPQAAADQTDYFSAVPNETSHFSREPNPFEKSFGQPSSEAADNKLLPSVAALTSPAPLPQEGSSTSGYNFAQSLRSGPLSPAMLGGPVGSSTDYFGPQPGGSFPGVTPNESSLRTGLTPGGGGSMFPAPSPGSQAFLQSLAAGGNTPNTIDFHRTAINAATASKQNPSNPKTSASQDTKSVPAAAIEPALQQQAPQQPTLGQHDNDAANGLFLLAQATNSQQASQYTPAKMNGQRRQMETSPNMAQESIENGSLNGSVQGSGDMSDDGDQGRMATRSKRKKPASQKGNANSAAARKAEDTPVKQPPNKKQKNGNAPLGMDEDDDDEEDDMAEELHESGRKMTDEEKRKNFLERNRVAALKCRQRKKQWLQNLQAKVEMFSTENDSLTAQVHALRDEVMGLKTLLIQHKDCPISQSQGLHQYFQQQEFNPHANPYGMGMPNGHQGLPAPRR